MHSGGVAPHCPRLVACATIDRWGVEPRHPWQGGMQCHDDRAVEWWARVARSHDEPPPFYFDSIGVQVAVSGTPSPLWVGSGPTI